MAITRKGSDLSPSPPGSFRCRTQRQLLTPGRAALHGDAGTRDAAVSHAWSLQRAEGRRPGAWPWPHAGARPQVSARAAGLPGPSAEEETTLCEARAPACCRPGLCRPSASFAPNAPHRPFPPVRCSRSPFKCRVLREDWGARPSVALGPADGMPRPAGERGWGAGSDAVGICQRPLRCPEDAESVMMLLFLRKAASLGGGPRKGKPAWRQR